jgi:hypothetical protein
MSEPFDERIEQWAAREAPRLMARAREEALQVAQARLRDELVSALMRASAAPPRPLPRHADQPEPRAASGLGLWVYGVVPGDASKPPGRPGVDGRPVELIQHAGVAALVTPVPLAEFGEEALKEQLEDLERLETLARAHDDVLNAALEAGDLLPFRMCTIYESADSLRRMLEREAVELAAALSRLAGKTEWGVKAYLKSGTARESAEAVQAPASGADYLARKREGRAAADARREAVDDVVAGVHARLAERASAAVLSRPHDRRISGREEEMVLNGAYLVPREGAEAFTELVSELARRHDAHGLTLEITGPWPAYHFVESAPG